MKTLTRLKHQEKYMHLEDLIKALQNMLELTGNLPVVNEAGYGESIYIIDHDDREGCVVLKDAR